MATKSQVYSWRLSVELKRMLEAEARRREVGLAELLEDVTRGWLAREGTLDVRERSIHDKARRWVGSISSGRGSRRSERVREIVRAKLEAKRDDRDRPR